MNERQPGGQEDDADRALEGERTQDAIGVSPEGERRGTPRVYVASLSDYVNGVLHGAWLDAAVEPEALETGIAEMLATSPTAARDGQPAEEWAVHDYENFGALEIGEYQSVEWLTKIAKGIEQHGPSFAAWLHNVGGDLAEVDRFEEVFLGAWDSVEDYARQLVEDLGTSPSLRGFDEWLLNHIDYGSIARDLQLGGDITVIENPEGAVWVFDGR